jgi:hypothetical protein
MENVYFDGESSICPICNGKIIHPHSGELTDAEIFENETNCHWIEVVDEGRSTIGYTPNCIGSQKHKSNDNEEPMEDSLVDLAVQAQELKFLLKLKELQSCIHRNIDKIDKNVILEMLDIIG